MTNPVSNAARIAYYVSGHGWGHARRSSQIVRELTRLRPDVLVHLRSNANCRPFADAMTANVSLHEIDVDAGCVECSILQIDPAATLERARGFVKHKQRWVDQEIRFVRDNNVSLLLTDIAFLPGEVSRATRIPCIAISNFTWDWIYAPFAKTKEDHHLLENIRSSYVHMDSLIRLPFGGVADFKRVVDCPLVATHNSRTRDAVLRTIGIDLHDSRPRVMVSMRGGLDQKTILAAASSASGMLFILPDSEAPVGQNIRCIKTSDKLSFSDLLCVCDVVIFKLGYGIVADCLAAKVGILWPRRFGFAEDAISEAHIPRYIRSRQISHDDLFAGRWGGHLHDLLAQPLPKETARTDGAFQAARIISEWLAP